MSLTRRHFLKLGGLSVSLSGFAASCLSCTRSSKTALEEMTRGVVPPGSRDYEERIERARAIMAKERIKALLLTPGSDLVYFTGVGWGLSERLFAALIPVRGDTAWICPAFEKERAAEQLPGDAALLTWEEHESPYALIADHLRSLPGGGSLAIGPSARHFVLRGLERDAPRLHLADGASVTQPCRARKTEKELAYMDLAARITNRAYHHAFSRLRSGMTAAAFTGMIREAHRGMGAGGGAFALFGENTAYPHGTGRRRDLREGDFILVDGGCSVEGYHSDVTRTVIFGKPTPKQQRVWDTVKKAQEAVFAAVQPGVACGSLDAVARAVITEAGFGPGYRFFTHRLGHGIGLDGHEYPYLVRGNDLKLAPGMTFSNEPGIYIYGEFGVRLEDCFAVTDTGVRILGEMPAETIDTPFAGL
ncbi:aminopeptidase P family protein [bacterium]|nr:aminopeptidase P family protein [bacterium]